MIDLWIFITVLAIAAIIIIILLLLMADMRKDMERTARVHLTSLELARTGGHKDALDDARQLMKSKEKWK